MLNKMEVARNRPHSKGYGAYLRRRHFEVEQERERFYKEQDEFHQELMEVLKKLER